MGIGKTTIAIASCHIQHIFNLMYKEIRSSSSSHLPNIQEPGVTCPSNEEMFSKFGFDCPCAKSSITYRIKPRFGVHCILSPLGLLETWCKEWKACYQENPLNMKLVLGHTNARAADGNQLSDSKADMLAYSDLGDPKDTETPPHCKPMSQNSSVIVVTTSNSFHTQVLQKFRLTKRVEWTPEGERKQKSNGDWYVTKPRPKYVNILYFPIVISSMWRDEAHKERLATSKTLTLLDDPFFKLPQNKNLTLNVMSGTLITSGPHDIAAYLQRMVRPAWNNHHVLRKYCGNELTHLGEKWNRAVKDGTANQQISINVIAKLRPVIEETTLRFTPASNFLGTGPVVILPPNLYSEVACEHSAEWNTRLGQHKEQEDREYSVRETARRTAYVTRHGSASGYTPLAREGVTFHYRSRLFASFPYLMDIMQDDGEPLRFTETEWNEKKGGWVGMNEPYRRHIKEIAESSGKLKRIKGKIDEWAEKIDGEGKPARLIFASFFFVGARIIYLVSTFSPLNLPGPLTLAVDGSCPPHPTRGDYFHPQAP